MCVYVFATLMGWDGVYVSLCVYACMYMYLCIHVCVYLYVYVGYSVVPGSPPFLTLVPRHEPCWASDPNQPVSHAHPERQQRPQQAGSKKLKQHCWGWRPRVPTTSGAFWICEASCREWLAKESCSLSVSASLCATSALWREGKGRERKYIQFNN